MTYRQIGEAIGGLFGAFIKGIAWGAGFGMSLHVLQWMVQP